MKVLLPNPNRRRQTFRPGQPRLPAVEGEKRRCLKFQRDGHMENVQRARALATHAPRGQGRNHAVAVLAGRQYTVGMTFRVAPEHDFETGDYSAVRPELPGWVSAGETADEARANIREAIEIYLAPREIDLPEDAKLFEVTVG